VWSRATLPNLLLSALWFSEAAISLTHCSFQLLGRTGVVRCNAHRTFRSYRAGWYGIIISAGD
jgi:hypothetical protein